MDVKWPIVYRCNPDFESVNVCKAGKTNHDEDIIINLRHRSDRPSDDMLFHIKIEHLRELLNRAELLAKTDLIDLIKLDDNDDSN